MSAFIEQLLYIVKNDVPAFALYLTAPVAIEFLILKFFFKKSISLKEGRLTALIGTIEVVLTGLSLFLLKDLFIYIEKYRLFRLDKNWVYFVLLFLAVEFIYYLAHLTSHKVRWFWNDHRVHHSSKQITLFAGNRNGWFFMFAGFWMFSIPFVLLGFTWNDIVWGIFTMLNYQFFLHTEVIKTLGPLEYILNTPSLHRVHHGKQDVYIDKNFGGATILFDYIFGTLQREIPADPPQYGLKNEGENESAFAIVFSGWIMMARDFKKESSWNKRLHTLIVMKKPI